MIYFEQMRFVFVALGLGCLLLTACGGSGSSMVSSTTPPSTSPSSTASSSAVPGSKSAPLATSVPDAAPSMYNEDAGLAFGP